MSEDVEKLERMLEQATATDMPPDGLDSEAASLREGWTAFGELLEASQPEEVQVSAEGWALQCPVRRRWLSPYAALAASLLIAVAGAWALLALMRPANTVAPPQQMTAKNEPRPVEQVVNPSPRKSSAPAWDDSLDQEIAQVGRRLTYVEQYRSSGADASTVLQYGIEQMQKDIEESKL